MVESDRDGGDTAPPHRPSNPNGARVKTAPAPTSSFFGDALQPQFRLNNDDDVDHDGDDEQENVPEDDSERSRSRSHSPAPATYTPPAAHQQQHLQPLRQPQPLQQQQQQQQQPPPTPTPTPTPFVAHVHFHSRVRIASGVRRPRGTRSLPSANDSSDSDSPSSSISAPLRYPSRDTVSRAPLTERVSRLATQALQKRRAATAIAPSPTASSPRRLRARDQEYTPLFRAGLPATYGAAQRRSRNNDAVDPVTDGADRRVGRPRIIQSHGEDELAFGKWPWRALNRHWWKWQIESTFSCCCTDESDADD